MRAFVLLAALGGFLAAPAMTSAAGPEYDQFGWPKRHAPRAAPWFLYWPYESYFQTPAPTGAAFYPSPMFPPPGFGQPGFQGGFQPGFQGGFQPGFQGGFQPGYGYGSAYGSGAYPVYHSPHGWFHHQ